MEPLSPQTVLAERYRIEEVVERSDRVIGYRVHDQKFGTAWYLQEIDASGTSDEARERFTSHAARLSSLRHPGMAQIVDHWLDTDRACVVREWIDGAPLADLLQKHPDGLPLEQVVDLGSKFLDVLYFFHTGYDPLAFRVLSPRTIWVGEDEETKVVDYGLPGILTRDQEDQRYVPPEAVNGEPVGIEGDIYAAGGVLYTMTTGRPPGDAPPETIRKEVPRALSQIIMKALAKDPKQRHQDVGAVKHDLMAVAEEFAPDATPSAGAVSSIAEADTRKRDERKGCGAAVLLLGLMLASMLAASALVIVTLLLLSVPASAEKAKWAVDNPPGPSKTIAIDTTEGTWMSVDVSPDGKQVAFDLLGDIYVIPIGGGEAKALTSGVSWDMQPRFSPNGRWIAFTSDRAGGDNIWIMDRDGGNPRQVTKETYRLLNSPAWTPDSEFIVARKHFTSHRSLGAGEMWLYHRSGGRGVQLTRRPSDQKDVGEPAFSPDGRYLYFSLDATPGKRFEYNKDPNPGIYAIDRLDRVTGEVERFIAGPGGAIRPTPSPDGRTVAFIRRVRARSVLFLHDVESGEERPIYDGLDRDMQETWAIHGVYPTMAWTPDGRSLVLWAQGRIQRIDARSGQVANLPFHVKGTRRISEALRFPVEVAPKDVRVRMLRWVRVSPSGDRVVYSALGKLWVRSLPDGVPTRLTSQDEDVELEAAFSRDGRWIAYTTWNDRALGRVRVIPAGGGESRVLTPQPGHYVQPVVSPDGARVVYRKIEGGYITSPLYGHALGVYQVPMGGGEPRRITADGVSPQFGRDPSRVYLTRFGEDDEVSLVSLGLHGEDERTHAKGTNVTDYRISPDERWLAFTQGFNAFLTPLPQAGRGITVGKDEDGLPVAQVSKDAGAWLSWSGDSRRLFWALGGELFERDLREAFAFIDGAPKQLPEPPSQGRAIGFTVPVDVPSGRLALVGGRVVTMRGDEVIEDGVVLTDGNRITAVGARGRVAIPADAHIVDVTGDTVLPGLVDVHAHGPQAENGITPQVNWSNYAALAFGVTTLHDPSNDTDEVFTASEMARTGDIVAPRIFSTGTILYGASGDVRADIESLEDAQRHVRRMKAVGAFSVKSYNQPRREQRQQVIAAARPLGVMVVPEGGSLFHHNMTMVVDGHTGVEHAVPQGRLYKDVIQLWSQSRTGYTPTLVVGYGGMGGENYWYEVTDVWADPRLSRFVPQRELDAKSRRRIRAPEEEYHHVSLARGAKALSDAGVLVNLGAHGQREGLAAHWEIWMMVQGGMSPHQALRAATLNGARYLGLDRDIGSLEPGKLADLFVVKGNPLQDVRLSKEVGFVVLNGRLYDADTMDEVWPRRKPRGRFYWER